MASALALSFSHTRGTALKIVGRTSRRAPGARRVQETLNHHGL